MSSASLPSRPEEPALVKEEHSDQQLQEQQAPLPPQHQQQQHNQQLLQQQQQQQPQQDLDIQSQQQFFVYQPQQQQYQVSQGPYIPLVTPPTAPQQYPNPPPSPPPEDARRNKKMGVPHIYHDYSAVPDSMGYVRKKTGGVTQPFPEKLMEMLTKETDCPSIVGWLPHGRAFIVRKPTVYQRNHAEGSSPIRSARRFHPSLC
ncbi:hypothetical protein MHU86_11493 [Fragilaria crotonensis]|nr:hypothetical protein MHU86_11493 [Fragilaria crotonensis]